VRRHFCQLGTTDASPAPPVETLAVDDSPTSNCSMGEHIDGYAVLVENSTMYLMLVDHDCVNCLTGGPTDMRG
jgi:hypothetical protein